MSKKHLFIFCLFLISASFGLATDLTPDFVAGITLDDDDIIGVTKSEDQTGNGFHFYEYTPAQVTTGTAALIPNGGESYTFNEAAGSMMCINTSLMDKEPGNDFRLTNRTWTVAMYARTDDIDAFYPSLFSRTHITPSQYGVDMGMNMGDGQIYDTWDDNGADPWLRANYASTNAMVVGEVFFFAAVYTEGGDFTIYLNVTGSVAATKTWHPSANMFNSSSQKVCFGGLENGAAGTQNWDGAIDEFMFWATALTSTQLSEISDNQYGVQDILDSGSDATAPRPTQSTINHTTAINDDNITIWQNDTSIYSITKDSTPTITFDTDDENARCAFGNADNNYSDMVISGFGANCSTTGSGFSHVCTLHSNFTLSEGDDTLYVGCRNSDGVENTTSSFSGLNVSLDTSAPAVTLKIPSDNTWHNQTTIDFYALIAEQSGGLMNVSLWTNNSGTWARQDTNYSCTNNTNCGSNFTFSADSTDYIWNFEACDDRRNASNSGNCGFASANFTISIDSTSPTATFIDVTDNSSNVSRTYVEVNVSGSDVNMNEINITFYNTSTGLKVNSSSSASTPFFVNFTGFIEGDYLFNATINDSAANSGATATRNIILDITNPTAVFIDTTTNTTNLSQSFIEANVSVTEANLDTINITIWNTTTGLKVNSSSSTSTPYFINFTGFLDGNYSLNATINDSGGNIGITSHRNIILDTINPSVSNINWQTTTGFTSSSILLLQKIKQINATISDINLVDSVFLELVNPNGAVVLNNVSMSILSGSVYNYTENITFDRTGTWNLFVYANDSTGNIGQDTADFYVSSQTLSSIDNWYGFGNGTILEADEITNLSVDYDYNIFEFEHTITGLSVNWSTILTAINASKEANVKVGLNLMLDFNYTIGTEEEAALENISYGFSDLILPPYTDTLEYISFEPIDILQYDDATVYGILNNISANATAEVSNEFVMFSKNYNSSSLDDSYISAIPFVFINENGDVSDEADLVDAEAQAYKYNSSETRFYITISKALKNIAEWFYDNIFRLLRGTIEIDSTISSPYIAEIDSVVHDVIIFNNQSSTQEFNVNISNISGWTSGLDVWDSTNNLLIENNTDGNISVNVSGYKAVMLFLDAFDHIQMSTLTTGGLYKSSAESSGNFSYGSAGTGGSWTLYGAQDAKIELADPTFIHNTFITYYGWINVSKINNWSQYDYIIFDDEQLWAVQNLTYQNTNSELYCYMSVSDYDDLDSWENSKKAEVDSCFAINSSLERLNMFVDGLDYGGGGENFDTRMKSIVDYVEVDYNRSVGLNTYTYYKDFCTWSKPDGFCMKESCVRRWNGDDSNQIHNFSYEDWNLELNRSQWMSDNQVTTLCQAFGNQTRSSTADFLIKNYSMMKDTFYAGAVLGYTDFYFIYPDFQCTQDIYHYDLGTDISNGYSTDDDETYYRQYQNGIVYYNTSNYEGWIDDGMTTEQVTMCAFLTDPDDTGGAEDSGIAFGVTTEFVALGAEGGIVPENLGIPNGNWYLFRANEVTAGPTWYCKDLNSSDYSDTGFYSIYWKAEDRNDPSGDGIYLHHNTNSLSGTHSYWDNFADVSNYQWNAYPNDQNWMVRLLVNKTQKPLVDITTNITQTESADNYKKNVTLSSKNDVNLEVWTFPFKISSTRFHNVTFWDGSDWINVTLTNTTDCDENNPTFAETTIDGATHKACYEDNSSNVIFRIAAPHLTSMLYQVDFDFENPSIEFIDITTNTSNLSQSNIEVNISASDPYLKIINFTIYNVSSGAKYYSNNSSSSFFVNVTGIPDGNYTFNATAQDESGNTNSTETRQVDLDTTKPKVFNFNFIALNSSKVQIGTNSNAFNFTNLAEIEYMNISFDVYDQTGIGDFKLFFTANGTNACSLGNNQSTTCYNFSSGLWIEFKEGENTTTFINDDGQAQGDSINCGFNGTSKDRSYSCEIDEHYNPNVYKHYPYNFSDLKWQNASGFRVQKNQLWKVNVSQKTIPTGAEFYKLDFRVDDVNNPTEAITAFGCNSTYTSGKPEDVSECTIVASKLPADLQDDGTKFRGIFTNALIEDLGDLTFIIIKSEETSGYYQMKTFNYLGSETIISEISTDNGSSYSVLADGYETELNLNWFHIQKTGIDPTSIIFTVETNDTFETVGNSSTQEMTWQNATLNLVPLVNIITPGTDTNISGSKVINWTAVDSNGDEFFINISVENGSNFTNLVGDLQSITNYTFSSTTINDGLWNLSVTAIENDTANDVNLTSNDTHQITIDNTAPTITLQDPVNGSSSTLTSRTFYFVANDITTDIINCDLIIDDNIDSSDSSITDGANSSITISNLLVATHNWSVSCNDTLSNSETSETRQFTISELPPGTPGGPGSGGGTAEAAKKAEISSEDCFKQDQDFFTFFLSNGDKKQDATTITNICDFNVKTNVSCFGNICDILEYSDEISIIANSSIEYGFGLFLPTNFQEEGYRANLIYDNQTIGIKVITKKTFFTEIKNNLGEEIEIPSLIPEKESIGKIKLYKFYLIVYVLGMIAVFIFLLLFQKLSHIWRGSISFIFMTLILIFLIIKDVIW